ncbi:M48 family metallopeptidase [Hathewaya limosa]|uniref:Metal-dependent hydrolase n=1 Tax=Hathewaya limosa TaxID=1536 RepID=A0ABU0JTX8_HATLI|nr:SprT family zinc-dependent metalloprotease [Hathewaya limosa]MDQ0480562.1 putative metal-dependent hydrolase [Hathewaya limosa]
MEIDIKRKKVKNITLKVKSQGTVHLTVPLNTSDEFINKFLKSKEKWIKKKMEFFKDNYKNDIKKSYIEGENHKYLGEYYKLQVISSKKEFVSLDIENKVIKLYVKDKQDLERKKELLHKFYIEKVKIILKELTDKYANKLNETYASIKIRGMKTRWGSCNPVKKYINFNLQLIEKPISSIEYVVLHELAHLKHPNHSKEFWNYVSFYMPDWKLRKQKLNN